MKSPIRLVLDLIYIYHDSRPYYFVKLLKMYSTEDTDRLWSAKV